MKKNLFYLLIVIGLLLITGCNNSKSNDVLKGKWKAPIEYQNVYIEGDESVGGEEEYILECDGKGSYVLTSNSGDLANASYTISNNKVTFYDEGREILAICKINDKELDCSKKSYYAFKYIKE